MINLRFWLHMILILAATAVAAQSDSARVTKDFAFEDGIYLSFENLQANQPALSWDEVDAQLVTSRQSFLAQVGYIRRKDGRPLPTDSIWGICLQGAPFIRLPDEATNKQAMAFAGIRVRGRICYYSYEVEQTKMVEIAAYNPLTGRPFRKGAVSRKEYVVREKILHLEDGRQGAFRKEIFLQWIEDDQQLWRTVADLSEDEVAKKLYKCLLIYDDRNPAYVPKR